MTMRIPSNTPTLNSAVSQVGMKRRTSHSPTLKTTSQNSPFSNPPRK